MKKTAWIVVWVFGAVLLHAQSLILNDLILVKTNLVPLKALFKNPVDSMATFSILSNCYLSNQAVSQIASANGLKDFTIVGKGISIILAEEISAFDKIKAHLSEKHRGVVWDDSQLKLPEGITIKSIDSRLSGKKILLYLTVYRIVNKTPITQNLSFALEAMVFEEKEILPDTPKAPIEEGVAFLRNIEKGSADIVYYKAGITIESRVRICKKLEDNYYLVENLSSRKVFKVRAE